jgi:hypothetical protein
VFSRLLSLQQSWLLQHACVRGPVTVLQAFLQLAQRGILLGFAAALLAFQ